MNDAQPKVEIRLATPNDATAISMILAEAFAEYEQLYTKEDCAATTPKSDVIKNRSINNNVNYANKLEER